MCAAVQRWGEGRGRGTQGEAKGDRVQPGERPPGGARGSCSGCSCSHVGCFKFPQPSVPVGEKPVRGPNQAQSEKRDKDGTRIEEECLTLNLKGEMCILLNK